MRSLIVLVFLLILLTSCGPAVGDPCYGRSDSAECNLYKSQLQTTLEASERNRLAEATRQTNEMYLQATRQASEVKQAEALANAGATATIEVGQSRAAIDQANAQSTLTAARIAENRSNADATATAVANDIQLSQNRIAATATAQAMIDHAAIERAKAEAELEAARWQTRIDLFVRFALGLAVLVLGAGIALKIFHTLYQWMRNLGNTLRDADGRIWVLTPGGRILDPRLLLQASTATDGSESVSEDTARRLKERDQAARVYEIMAKNSDRVADDEDGLTKVGRHMDSPAQTDQTNPDVLLPETVPWSMLNAWNGGALPLGMNTRNGVLSMVQADLERAAHLLFAGTSGAGKTRYGLRPVITSALVDGWLVIVIDRSGLDFIPFREHPNAHIIRIDDPTQAIDVMSSVFTELQRRLRLLYDLETSTWGQLQPGHPHGPRVLLIVDEFGNLADALDNRDREELWRQARMIAAEGRKAGIHEAIALQDPTYKSIDLRIRRNMTPVAFRLRDDASSRVVLGQNGAEVLRPRHFLTVMDVSAMTRGVAFNPHDEEITSFLQSRPVRPLPDPVWLGASSAQPKTDRATGNETARLAEDIRGVWLRDGSRSEMARAAGFPQYGGHYRTQIDRAIQYLVDEASTTTPRVAATAPSNRRT